MLSKTKKKNAIADLHAPLENRLLFFKPAFDMVASYKYIETLGREILIQNMIYCKDKLKLPSFDPDNPYKDYDCKNMYFSAANKLCQFSLWRQRLYGFAEIYYSVMLNEIKKFENKRKFNHNKGMVYANLGIAQAMQLNIDEGFANILKALVEDRGYFGEGKKPTEEFFKTRLFIQLEERIVLSILEKYIKALRKDGEACPSAKDLLNGLVDPDQRIFFEYTFARIMDNHRVWTEKPNRFSANRMIAYLQDMCLFAEDFLKRKRYTGMLKNLIRNAFPGVDLTGCRTGSWKKLNAKLEQYYRESNKRDRALRMLLTLRNFSSHNISAGESKDFILKNFDKIFTEILRAVINIFRLPEAS